MTKAIQLYWHRSGMLIAQLHGVHLGIDSSDLQMAKAGFSCFGYIADRQTLCHIHDLLNDSFY